LRALGDAPFAGILEELRLVGCDIEGPACKGLARASLPALRCLDLSENRSLSPAAFAALLKRPRLWPREELNLSWAPVGDEGMAALAASGLPGPRWLCLRACKLTAAGAAHLAAWPGLAQVRSLTFGDQIGDDGIRALTESPHATSLEALDLDHGNGSPTAKGVQWLLRSPLAQRLRYLNLVGVRGAYAAARVLTSQPLEGLRELQLGRAAASANGRDAWARLREAMPQCVIG
jgi:hypothetical protein